ncbi:hypothetical protein PHLGIDRAFT_14865 [Phlebiopsis gigantea 11061_1 CR5-6]|uniref:Uncharacterized protein n=1 Tax=Phlebiopsis gigantea (strain 11061_1 CR5-6) TaxID=745531 RepID=A0A0C3S4B3_PHLG1|nr:hypothetical protein PHLGIDRAFT_14865 [Phlebiopsis gigantea 11061_1 CR5-6]
MSNIPREIVARREFNRQQSISRLPNEVLCEIFLWTMASLPYGANYQWLKIFHVCHTWYVVATGYSLLWQTLSSSGGLECTKTLLQRSQSLPLRVYATFIPLQLLINIYGHPAYPRTFSKVIGTNLVSMTLLEQMSRIERLFISAGNNFWEYLRVQPPPCKLKTLGLDLKFCLDIYDRVFNANTDWIFSSPLPALRELYLNLGIPASGIIRASDLRLLQISVQKRGEYNPRDLIESIRQMPLLEAVDLQHTLFDINDDEELDAMFNVDAVQLPNIKYFSFADCDPVFTRFLRCVAFPVTAQVILGCDVFCPVGALSAVAAFGEKIAARERKRLGEPYRLRNLSVKTCVSGSTASERSLRFQSCVHGEPDCFCDISDRCTSPTLSLTLAYVNPSDDHEWDRLDGFSETLELLPLSDVEVLHIKSLDVYNTFKAHLGLLASAKVAGVAGPELPEDVHHFTVPAAPGEIHCELEAGLLGLMPKLKTICLDLTPESRVLGETVLTESDLEDMDTDVDTDDEGVLVDDHFLVKAE